MVLSSMQGCSSSSSSRPLRLHQFTQLAGADVRPGWIPGGMRSRSAQPCKLHCAVLLLGQAGAGFGTVQSQVCLHDSFPSAARLLG